MKNKEKDKSKGLIALPESRQLNILAKLLENRGASVLRVPLIAIHDAPNSADILAWMDDFIKTPPDVFIIFTGEGLRRLLSLADRHSLRPAFVEALSRVKKLCRGPKPARELRDLKLSADIEALAPTTDGVIETLDAIQLEGLRITVQLYGEEPNHKLIEYLKNREALVETVAPYIYADQAEEGKVIELIEALSKGDVKGIAFTSQPQFKRLHMVAKKAGQEKVLLSALSQIKVAAIGPLVKEKLELAGVRVDIMPQKNYFMKPLVSAMMRELD